MLGVWMVRIPEYRREDLGCTLKFPLAWGGVDEIKGGQATQENLVPIQVAGEPRDAMMGRVAVDKSGQVRHGFASVSRGDEDREPFPEIAVQGRVQARRPVGLPWEKAGRYAQLFVEKLRFFDLRFEVLKIGMGQDEVENQQPGPNEISGVGPMIPKVLLANQIVKLA